MKYFLDNSSEEFYRITGYDIKSFFLQALQFEELGYPNIIISYYAGLNIIPNNKAFLSLTNLQYELKQIINLFINYKDVLIHGDFWDLLEQCENMQIYLESLSNASKYLRSAITKNNFSRAIEVDQILKQNQSLETLTKDLGYSEVDSIDTAWINLAKRNDLREEDYTFEGGNKLQVSSINNLKIEIFNIVDTISPDRLLGIDLDRVITFENDDLKVLSPIDTFKQTISILSSLKKGQNPEFPGNGISHGGIIGENKNSIFFPALFRQITQTFSNDDTIKSIEFTNISYDGDSILIDINISSRLGDIEDTQTIYI